MSALSRREFTHLLGAAAVAGFGLGRGGHAQAASPYDAPPPYKGAGAVSLLHMTDCHAQLLPVYFREPSVNLGVGEQRGKLPHLVGDHLLKATRLAPGSPEAYAFTALDFERAARRYGKVGGFAHLATLVKRLKASRPGALLLDGGDTWQGSATALWSNGQDMVDACKLLGVDLMTGHWEFTLGAERVRQLVDGDLKAAGIEFLAANVRTADFGDEVFKPYVVREIAGVPVAIIGTEDRIFKGNLKRFKRTHIKLIAGKTFTLPPFPKKNREEKLQEYTDEIMCRIAALLPEIAVLLAWAALFFWLARRVARRFEVV